VTGKWRKLYLFVMTVALVSSAGLLFFSLYDPAVAQSQKIDMIIAVFVMLIVGQDYSKELDKLNGS